MNIANIANSTIAKLNKDEICELGLYEHGVGLYRGELKTRFKGVSRKSDDGITFRFEYACAIFEFTQIASSGDEKKEWALRVFDKVGNHYCEYPLGIIGCDFIR